MNEKQRRHIGEVIPLFILGAFLIAFIVLSTVSGDRLAARLGRITQGWTLNGETVERLPERDIRTDGGTSELRVTLGGDFDRQQTLCFYSVYEDVDVYLNGESVYSFRRPDAESIVKAAPNVWNTVALPGGCAGAELTVRLYCPYEQYANMLGRFYYGDSRAVSSYTASQTVPRFAVALMFLSLGLVFAVVALYMRYHLDMNTGFYSLSLFIMVLAIFLASQQTTLLLELYDGTSYIFIQNIAFILCPVMYTRFLMRSQTGMQRKIAFGLNLVSIANLIIVTALQLLRVRDFPEMMSSTRNLCVISIIYVFILEMRMERRVLIVLFGLLLSYCMLHYFRTGAVSWLAYIIMFVHICVLVYRLVNTVLRARAEEIRLESALEVSKSELATVQITSHFFYHTLDSIRALIRLDADRAYKMTGDFAKYIRYRVDGIERLEETVSFRRELRSIRAYTDIKSAQLGGRFEMRFEIENDDFELLPLTVQPLVENAVIHAMQRRREGGLVRLVCRETDAGMYIEVIDNGPGENARSEAPADAEKRSIAIDNVNRRLKYYGIAPVRLESNEYGGMTASFTTPRVPEKKGDRDAGNTGR